MYKSKWPAIKEVIKERLVTKQDNANMEVDKKKTDKLLSPFSFLLDGSVPHKEIDVEQARDNGVITV